MVMMGSHETFPHSLPLGNRQLGQMASQLHPWLHSFTLPAFEYKIIKNGETCLQEIFPWRMILVLREIAGIRIIWISRFSKCRDIYW